ncbi:MAG: hypothetical protein ACI85F_001250, partial [Bacteroidia bacterium]
DNHCQEQGHDAKAIGHVGHYGIVDGIRDSCNHDGHQSHDQSSFSCLVINGVLH